MQPAFRHNNIHFIPPSASSPQPQHRLIPSPPINQQTNHLYEQLRQRQIQYINLIRDLHNQNHRLRAMLASQYNNSPTITIKPPQHASNNKLITQQIPSHTRTPSFNSLANSRSHTQIMNRNYAEQGHYLKSNNRFSFGDITQPAVVEHKQPIKVDKLSENSITNQHTPVLHIPQQYQYNDIKLAPLNRVFSNLLSPPEPRPKLQQIRKVSSSKNINSGQIEQNHNKMMSNNIQQNNSDKLWNMKTNKSISKSSSRNSDDQILDQTHKYDHISQYSQVCSKHPYYTSSNKLKRLINHDNSPNSMNMSNIDSSIPSLQYIPEVMEPKHHHHHRKQQYYQINSYQSVPDSHPDNTIKYIYAQEFKQPKRNKQEQIRSQKQSMANYQMKNVNETLTSNLSPRNKRPVINNKIYL